MQLYQVKERQSLLWPAAFTEIPETSTLTRRGRERFREKHRAVRGLAGFVVDMDSPGEGQLCAGHNGCLEPVPAAEREAALERIEEQGAITFQPALDWLEAQGLAAKIARPASAPADAAATPLKKLLSDDLKALCDKMGLPHANVKEMRKAIAASAECTTSDVVFIDDEGDVAVKAEGEGS
jgi:hypothetical protein